MMQIQTRILVIALLSFGWCLPTVIGQQPGTVNIRPRVAAPQPGVPNVRVNVDRNRVPLGHSVTFTIARESESVVKDPRFTVMLYPGDHSRPKKMGLEPITYFYDDPGTYTYGVKVERSPLPSVQLIANPTTVATNSSVNFIARLSRDSPNIKYHFVFADESETDWQDASQTSHSYGSAKTYLPFVDIREGSGGLTLSSRRQPIQVTNPAPRGNTNTNQPPRGDTNTNQPPRGNTNTNQPPRGNTNTNQPPRGNTNTNLPPRGNTNTNQPPRGNTNTNTNTTRPTNTNNNTTPTNNNSTPTNFNANTTTTSTNTDTSPSPPCVGEGCDRSWPWWILLLIAALLITLAYKAATVFLLPRPQLVPNLDPGNSRVAPGKPLSIDLQLELDPDVTGGEYGLQTEKGSLIKSERGSDG